MITVKKIFRPWMVLFVAIPLLIGCGDGTRNDQGVSFTALGWYDKVTYVEADIELGEIEKLKYANNLSNQTPIVSASVPLSTDVEGEGEGASLVSYIGMQNNLASQFIRTERAYHEYYIPGASIQPPSTSIAINAVLMYNQAAREDKDDQLFGSDSSLPDHMSNFATYMVFSEIPIVTSDVRTFINMNKDRMPEPPFVMIVNTYVEGVTSAGKRIKTNSISFDVYWTTPSIIRPTVNGGNDNNNNTDNVDLGYINVDY